MLKTSCPGFLVLALLLTGCSGPQRLTTFFRMEPVWQRSYDNGRRDVSDEDAIKSAVEGKWPCGTLYWRIADDILKSGAQVQSPGSYDPRGSRPAYPPDAAWVVRFGPDYIELMAAEFAWYGQWWYSILLEFNAGVLTRVSVRSDNVCL